jgi:dynein light chain Tctex-type 1
MAFEGDEELVMEDVREAIRLSIGNVFGQRDSMPYNPDKVNSWSQQIIDFTLRELVKLAKPFKYVVTCVIMQSNGSGLQSAAAAYWDTDTDGISCVQGVSKDIGVLKMTALGHRTYGSSYNQFHAPTSCLSPTDETSLSRCRTCPLSVP